MINVKKYIWAILIIGFPLFVGFGFSGFSMNSKLVYQELEKPFLSPPSIVFPVMWTILYVMMGLASYLVCKAKVLREYRNSAYRFFIYQLLVNCFWSIFFFTLGWRLVAFIWLLLLWGLIVVTMKKFKPISMTAFYLMMPYLLWVTFAGYLNLGFYLLNR